MSTTQTTVETRLRERLASVHDAWRLLDRQLEEVMAHPFDPGRMRDLLRCRGRMADVVDLLAREWVLHDPGAIR